MAFCIHCGEKLPDAARFCPRCGNPIPTDDFNDLPTDNMHHITESAEKAPTAKMPTPPPKKPKTGTLSICRRADFNTGAVKCSVSVDNGESQYLQDGETLTKMVSSGVHVVTVESSMTGQKAYSVYVPVNDIATVEFTLSDPENKERGKQDGFVFAKIAVPLILLILVVAILVGWILSATSSKNKSESSQKPSPAATVAPVTATPTPGMPETRDIGMEEMAQTFSAYLTELAQYSEEWSAFLSDEYSPENARTRAEQFREIAERVQEMHADVESMNPDPLCAEWKQTMLQVLSDMKTVMTIVANMDTDKDGTVSSAEVTVAKTSSSELLPPLMENVQLVTQQAEDISARINQPGGKTQLIGVVDEETQKTDTTTPTPKPTATPKPTTKPTTKPKATATPKPSSSRKNTGIHTDEDAFIIATAVVKESLKAPSTAKFCKFYEATVTYLGNDKYEVKGWVDAQNSYGAMIRQKFTVTYTAVKRGEDIGCTGAKCTFSD